MKDVSEYKVEKVSTAENVYGPYCECDVRCPRCGRRMRSQAFTVGGTYT